MTPLKEAERLVKEYVVFISNDSKSARELDPFSNEVKSDAIDLALIAATSIINVSNFLMLNIHSDHHKFYFEVINELRLMKLDVDKIK